MQKFTIILEQDEDGVWISECPSIPGCVSQGKVISVKEHTSLLVLLPSFCVAITVT
uniref:HicB_like antitoxin of toxin-antitoxin system n=1 Tax=Candidatus Kentrum sp. FM TaxID=2126340 RepID=A0A450TN35_9GAMM|nr:MAG: hypothetical protein BECKFM1743C_GA0114222_105127 [Candidatus Kentron sp. FM]VFJ72069.1 MAG: hypothetical protein BECKFM1743A_GA0114220_106217 [Candidatus Kentron sp. FM]